MKKTALCFILFFLNQLSFSQNLNNPKQLKGKIKSYSTYQVSPDAPKQKLKLIDSLTFDQQGNLITASYYGRVGRTIHREKYIYKGNTAIRFSCYCRNIADLDQLEKEFKIKDNKAIQDFPNVYTNHEPTQFVKYTIFDKQKHVILEAAYSAGGYKQDETKYIYNHSGKVLSAESRDDEGMLTKKINYRYDEKGNLIEINDSLLKSVTLRTPLIETSTFQYDNKGTLTLESSFRNSVVYADYQYSTKQDKNSKSFIRLDKIRNTSNVDSTIYYGLNKARLKKVKQLNGELEEILEFDYYENGQLKTESRFDKDNNLAVKTFFNNDKTNNRYKQQFYETIMHHNSNGVLEKTERRLIEYEIQIQYYR